MHFYNDIKKLFKLNFFSAISFSLIGLSLIFSNFTFNYSSYESKYIKCKEQCVYSKKTDETHKKNSTTINEISPVPIGPLNNFL